MKKIITLSSVLFGVVLLAGCGQQQTSQTQSTTPASVTQQPSRSTANQQQTIDNQPAQTDSAIAVPTDWKTYLSNNLGISFQYPNDWYIKEDESINRIYIRNVQEDINKGNMPSDFQQVWISTWTQDVSAQTENNVKSGKPDGRAIMRPVTATTIDSNVVIINIYEYETIGGPALQAFWIDKSGKKYYATNSTEVGKENQQNMVVNLKKILYTVKFTK